MAKLFAEAFLELPEEHNHQQPEHRYDDARSLCVLNDGRVYVENAPVGETQTSTKALGEQDDDDDTVTKLQGEADVFGVAADGSRTAIRGGAGDWAGSRKGTETITLVKSEGFDWVPQLDTVTRVRAECDDWSS